MSELLKKMTTEIPAADFPADEMSFREAAGKLGFSTSDIDAALAEKSGTIIDDEELNAIAGGARNYMGQAKNPNALRENGYIPTNF
jgi:hypothetical protein